MQTNNPFDPKTGAAIADMINAFLKWPLPESVRVDACCLDTKAKHRTGTNIFTVVEAMQMVQEVVCPVIAEYQADQSATQIQELRRAKREAQILREALERLRDCDWVISLPDRMDAVRELARQALLTPPVSATKP